jgi:DNA-binding NtrC family response regulator
MSAGRPDVLIVDDDANLSRVLRRETERLGFRVSAVGSGKEALESLASREVDVVLLDIRLGDADGIEILKRLKADGVGSEVVILTGHGTVENAIQAMKIGAFDFLTKPCKLSELEAVLRKAVESRRVHEQNRGYRQYLSSGTAQPLLTRDAKMLKILESLDRVAASMAPVLILGESGTGKELIAREIHRRAPHRDRPFVTVNCAVLQASILESELFGHEKGAFTGAVGRKLGLFEIADGGAIFLDEIGEIDEGIQAKLLRVLQFGEFRRVGGNETRSVDVRVIAATNKDLEAASRENRFRQDLFFRLNVVQIDLPPLRERPGDIDLLAAHFLEMYGGGGRFEISAAAQSLLKRYGWPGNIRELENVVRRLLIFQEKPLIGEEEVLAVLPRLEPREDEEDLSLEGVERRHILRVLALRKGNKRAAAKDLGISLRTLYNKLHAYGWNPAAD